MTARLRRKMAEALAEHQVAWLALIEEAVVFTTRTLMVTYPTIFRRPRRSDHPELTSARQLLDACGYLLVALDDHWKQAAVHLRAGHPAKAGHDDAPF